MLHFARTAAMSWMPRWLNAKIAAPASMKVVGRRTDNARPGAAIAGMRDYFRAARIRQHVVLLTTQGTSNMIFVNGDDEGRGAWQRLCFRGQNSGPFHTDLLYRCF